MHFTPPPRHWRNSCLSILTRRTSKLLPRELPIRRGWLISQVQITTKSHWLNTTRAFPAHARLLVDPTILQDPCPPRGGSAFQLLWTWVSIMAAAGEESTKGFCAGHLPLPFQSPLPARSSLFWVTEVCSAWSCPHWTWPMGNASRISKGRTWVTSDLTLHGVMVACCIPLLSTRACSLFLSLYVLVTAPFSCLLKPRCYNTSPTLPDPECNTIPCWFLKTQPAPLQTPLQT